MGTFFMAVVVALVIALGAYFAFRGDEEVLPTPTPEPTPEVTATMPPTPEGTQPPEPTDTPPAATPEPTPTLEVGRVPEPAPIESVNVESLDSSPPQYVVTIIAGLPSGCAEPYAQEIARQGDVFVVTILNSMPEGNVPCTLIFRTYEVRVTIGERLEPGRTYTVRVNDQETTFTAE